MRVIDEKGRLFGKINIFDLIVLIALIIVVGAVGYKIVKDRQSVEVPTKTYIATIKVSAMPETFVEALKKDNRIYYDSDGFTNARIVDIREEPAVITIQTDDGRLVETISPKLKDVYVDIEIDDKVTEPDIRVARFSVQVGGKFTLKTIYAMGAESLVLDLKEK